MLMAGKHVQVSNTQSLNNVSSSLVKIYPTKKETHHLERFNSNEEHK